MRNRVNTWYSSVAMLIVISLLGSLLFPNTAFAQLTRELDQDIRPSVVCPNTYTYTILRPIVNQKKTSYKGQIDFEPGDIVRIKEAGGCVQTGGSGSTWKLYVNPQGSNSARLYHGVLRIPYGTDAYPSDTWVGPGFMRVASMLGPSRLPRFFSIPLEADPAQSFLWLGYEDDGDNYDDNGYTDPDPGTDFQCLGDDGKRKPTAYIVIEVTKRKPALECIPATLLSTEYVNAIPSIDVSDNKWASNICGNDEYLSGWAPPWEWTPVFEPNNDFDSPLIGISGKAVLPGVSDKDIPFTHPFGFDWEFFVAPDPSFEGLFAPSNTKDFSSPSDPPGYLKPDSEYADAIKHAIELGVGKVNGVVGVETDRGLIPQKYRARDGDRVAVFGRWVVDCGHKEFQTEIHPPLLLATARAESYESTYSTLIGRPFLVRQDFEDGASFKHIVFELLAASNPLPFVGSWRIEAHPEISTLPFQGTWKLSYVVRPPTPRRASRDVLITDYRFHTRDGISIQLYPSSTEPDAVVVLITMNSSQYRKASLPNRQDWDLSLQNLGQVKPGLPEKIKGGIFMAAFNPLNPNFTDPWLSFVMSRGILTDYYNLRSPPEDRIFTTKSVPTLSRRAPVLVDNNNNQPFPIYGWLRLRWRRYQQPS